MSSKNVVNQIVKPQASKNLQTIESSTSSVGFSLASPTGNHSGNAHITIPYTLTNNLFDDDVWLTSFQINSFVQYDNQQVHRGMSWFPIRRNEATISFSIAWPYQSSQKNSGNFFTMQAFQDALRQSQQTSVLNTGNAQPMTLTYYNNSAAVNGQVSAVVPNNLPTLGNDKLLTSQVSNYQGNNSSLGLAPLVYQGWIDTVDKIYNRFKSVYIINYRMNVLNPITQISYIDPTSATEFVPNKMTVSQYGLTWAQTNTSNGNGVNISQITGSSDV